METRTKDPDAVLDYSRTWARWLKSAQPDEQGVVDTIIASTWLVPDGLTKTDDTHDETVATVWLSGGTLFQSYKITNRITTRMGRTEDRSVLIKVMDR